MSVLAVVLAAIGTLAFLYLLFLAIVAWLTLHPMRIPLFLSPGALGLPQESVQFGADDGVSLRGWWMDQDNPKGVFILAHGYLMNRAEPTPLAKRLWEAGFACLIFDFRCHGSSGGSMSTIGWAERLDVAAAFAEAERRYPDAKKLVWGSSMGAAATCFAMADCGMRPQAVVLDSAYSRLLDANKGWWTTFFGRRWAPVFLPSWWFGWLFTKVDPRQLDVATALRAVPCPALLLYGDLDLIVPPNQARRNDVDPPRTEIVFFEGVQHSQPRWLQTQKYDSVVLEFVERQLRA